MTTESSMSAETERVQRVGYVLWGVVLASVLLGGLAAASGTLATGDAGPENPAADTNGVDDTTNRAERVAESRWGVPVDIDVDADAPSFDFAVDLPGVAVSGENVGDPSGPQSVGIDSDAIDEGVADSASVGLCAVGLDGPNPSGVTVDVDGNGSADASIDPAPDPGEGDDPRRESAQSVVDRCTDDG
jgi:hypothetical protein